MAAITDVDRNPFENLCKGIHDFNEEELVRLREASEQVKAILKAANGRQQRKMDGKNQLKQMGTWS